MRNVCRDEAASNASGRTRRLSISASAMRADCMSSNARGVGHHRRLVAHQQRIVHDVAQALQRRADRRLRLVQLDRGARDAALGNQHAEHAQQVGVERVVGSGHRPPPCWRLVDGASRELRGAVPPTYSNRYAQYSSRPLPRPPARPRIASKGFPHRRQIRDE